VTGASAEIHERIAEEIGNISDTLVELSLDLHAHPELAMEEKYAASRLSGLLRADFAVEEGIGGLPTAFRGTAGSGVASARVPLRVRRAARHRARLRA